jgi:hypothetical protein
MDFSKLATLQSAIDKTTPLQAITNAATAAHKMLEKQLPPIFKATAFLEKAIPKTAVGFFAQGMTASNAFLEKAMPKTAVEFFAQGMTAPKIAIPNSALDIILSLANQAEKMSNINQLLGSRHTAIEMVAKAFENEKLMNMALQKSMAVSQLVNWQNQIDTLTESLTKNSIHNQAWGSLQYFEQFTTKVTALSEEIAKQETEIQNIVDRIVTFLYQELEYLKSSPKHASAQVINMMAVFSFFWQFSFVQDIYVRKSESATKQDIERIVEPLQTAQKEFLRWAQSRKILDRRITNRPCRVRLRNKSNSICIAMLEQNMSVDVIQIHHEWVYVSYINPKHGFIESGWVMKKYLREY